MPKELDYYSLMDLWYAYSGYLVNQAMARRTDWEIGRMVAFFASAPHTKKIKKPSDVITFEWEKRSGEKGTRSNKWTKAEIDKMIKDGTHPLLKHIKNGKEAY